MWEFLQTVGGRISIISAVVIGIISILEKISSIKLWSWLKKLIAKQREKRLEPLTKAMNDLSSNVNGKFDATQKRIDELFDLVEMNRVAEIKFNILDFHNALMNGKKVSLDQFELMKELIYEYNEKYHDRHNGELKDAIEFIEEQEKKCREEVLAKARQAQK